MKKIIAIAALFLMGITFAPKAQAQINIQINIGNQPAWGPTGYDYAQFYYFPDYNFYYDVMTGQYIIYRRNAWVYTTVIPAAYGFNPYRAYKVVINQNRPYAYNASHIRSYGRYKGQWARQQMIRDSRDYKYFASKSHPRHNEWNQRIEQPRQNHTVTSTVKRNNPHTYTNSREEQYSSKPDNRQNTRSTTRNSNVNSRTKTNRR